jgi:pyrimidine-nucleoside phosphorylase
VISPYDFIRSKRSGKVLNPGDIREFVRGYMDGKVADYQMSAWLMAVSFEGLRDDELFGYTGALIESGERFDLSGIKGFKADKHSTGGVGDKVSLVLAPLAASCGLVVPMVSGRGLGHTGGTLDKLAAIPGFRTDLSRDEFIKNLEETGVAMMGQTKELCPADGRIYALRDVTATVESIPLIAASIASKKIAEGTQGLVLDVKVGAGAFMKTQKQGVELARAIMGITERFGVRTHALLTNMDEPTGKAVGNALEVREALDCLKGAGPQDLRTLVLELCAEMLALSGDEEPVARERAVLNLDSGKALEKFREMVRKQNGDERVADDYSILPQARERTEVRACETGVLTEVDTYRVGMLAVELGAGRRRSRDAIDPAVGFVIEKKLGDKIDDGDLVATVYANERGKGEEVAREMTSCFRIGEGEIEKRGTIIKRIV